MLHLQSESTTRWLKQVDEHLDEILIDHALCEHKAAATALSLFGGYIDCEALTREMTIIVNEELEHFQMVLDLLKRRGVAFRKLRPGDYGKRLSQHIRLNEPFRAVDRLLVAGLIEARSCERFKLLRDHVHDRELADFYGSLFESEARHHTTYTKLAREFQSDDLVRARLDELSAAETAIIAEGNPLPRMHS